MAKLEFHEIVTCIALVDVSSDDWVIFHSWVTISWLELNLVESSLVTGLEHKMVRNVEDVKRRFWSCVDEELKRLEFLWRELAFELGLEPWPKVIATQVNPGEVSNEQVTIIFDKFLAFGEDLRQHIILVDEC